MGVDLLVGEPVRATSEAHRRGLCDIARADVRGHDDDGVGEVDSTALPIRQTSFIQNLEQDIEDVRVCLLDLIEQHDRVRTTSHCLGELATLVVAHIARGSAHKFRDLVLLHKLRHVKADQGILRAEQEFRECLRKLGLTDAGGSQKDEGTTRTARVFERRAASSDGAGHRGDRLVLADDTLMQCFLAAQQLGGFRLGQVGHRDSGDRRHDICDSGGRDGRHVLVDLLVPGPLELLALVSELFLLVTVAQT